MSDPLPASQTKHLPVLLHPLPRDLTTLLTLRQLSSRPSSTSILASTTPAPLGSDSVSGTGTTGTTLWLSAQIVAVYLSSLLLPSTSSRRVLDLGSGVGYIPLVLSSLGYDMVASDIEPVLSSVLRPNLDDGLRVLKSTGRDVGDVRLLELDWTDPAKWRRMDDDGFSMIVSTDTLYHRPLVQPFWDALLHFSDITPTPLILLGIERRDTDLVDSALEIGREMGFDLRRVGRGRMEKCVEKAGWGWKGGEGWEGVEIWRGRFRGRRKTPLGEECIDHPSSSSSDPSSSLARSPKSLDPLSSSGIGLLLSCLPRISGSTALALPLSKAG